ncbi:hypothetical protein [Methanosarcina siciliae]|uniref:hypothetical protein n=1 Tax=Methanosarcina siciliae TaxID=38027 RepID=UPI000A87E765|nr:hypothetical protein [Methanosarcina siciliae]
MFKPSAMACGKSRCPNLKYRDSTRKEGSTSYFTYCGISGKIPGKMDKCPKGVL